MEFILCANRERPTYNRNSPTQITVPPSSYREDQNKPQIILVKLENKIKNVKDDIEENEEKQCVLCSENRRKVVFSCGHSNFCVKCSLTIMDGKKECPICRKEIEEVMSIFI